MSEPFKPTTVRCPGCGGDSRYAADNPNRPFCSARCKHMDFGAWANEQFRVEADAPPDDDGLGSAQLQ